MLIYIYANGCKGFGGLRLFIHLPNIDQRWCKVKIELSYWDSESPLNIKKFWFISSKYLPTFHYQYHYRLLFGFKTALLEEIISIKDR